MLENVLQMKFNSTILLLSKSNKKANYIFIADCYICCYSVLPTGAVKHLPNPQWTKAINIHHCWWWKQYSSISVPPSCKCYHLIFLQQPASLTLVIVLIFLSFILFARILSTESLLHLPLNKISSRTCLFLFIFMSSVNCLLRGQ